MYRIEKAIYPERDVKKPAQVGELFTKFDEAEGKIDKEVVARCRRFVEEVEQRIKKLKKEVVK